MINNDSRPDLSDRSIIILLCLSVLVIFIILIFPAPSKPGSPFGQVAATLGSLLLTAPAIFTIMKRSGLSASPPVWFVVHVLSTLVGVCLIFAHVRSADWVTPPGLVLFLLVFLILQGCFLRVIVSRGFSLLFARNSTQHGFATTTGNNKDAIQNIIDQKVELLNSIDNNAQEALYSPPLAHWLKFPLRSFRYQRLAQREAALVGARTSAGKLLAWSRRIHMIAAALFFAGLITHIVIVLFFAGYASGGENISWWYITDWGRK